MRPPRESDGTAGVGSRRLTTHSEVETFMAPFQGKKTEAQRREAAYPRPCVWEAEKQGFEPTSVCILGMSLGTPFYGRESKCPGFKSPPA